MDAESTAEWNQDGAGGAETTHAAPADEPETTASETTRVDGSELAWSLDDTDEAQPVRHSRVVTAGLAALVAGVAATGIWFGSTYFSWPASKHVAPSSVPATSTPAKPAAAPPSAPPSATVTVTPPAPPPPPPAPALVFSDALDQRFLITLVSNDYTITNPDWAIANAHRYCVLVQQGSSEIQAQQTAAADAISAHPLGNEVGIESKRPWPGSASAAVEADWNTLTTTAAHVYPDCVTR